MDSDVNFSDRNRSLEKHSSLISGAQMQSRSGKNQTPHDLVFRHRNSIKNLG